MSSTDQEPWGRGDRPELRGRAAECSALDALLADVRSGISQALVLRGEAGIGKSALLDYLVAGAGGCRIARAAGVESEMELAFAGLHQLCTPCLGHLDQLPEPQRDALGTALGLQAGDTPDRFRVGLAVLSLLADAAADQPLVCVVDDAQWIDHSSIQTLAFVGRRLAAESVVIAFAIRDPVDTYPLDGLAELVIAGLDDGDAGALLRSVVTGPMDDRVRERIVAETHGNPLALLELPHALTPEELAGGFGLPAASSLAGRIEAGFRRRLEPLPEDTRHLLLVAAAEPLGDPVLVQRAAAQLGVEIESAAPAAAAGLVDLAGQVRFRHPLLRSAVYRAASPSQRREVHGALAEVTDAVLDPDRRIWHRAHATAEPDDAVAAELERSAERAQTRGGLAAAATFLEEATRLTVDRSQKGRRALVAARTKQQAGSPDGALSMLVLARANPLDELEQAQATVLEAQVAFDTRRGSDAPGLLLAAARQLEPLDLALARSTYLDALAATVSAGRLTGEVTMGEVAGAARAAPGPDAASGPPDRLLYALAVLATEGRPAAVSLMKDAVAAFRTDDLSIDEGLRWLWLAGRVADDLKDDDSWHAIVTRQVDMAREAGALTALPAALRARIIVHVVAGELDAATALLQDARAVTEVTGTQLAAYGATTLAAWRGDDTTATELVEATIADATLRGEGMGLSLGNYASAVLHNGHGRYREALEAAKRASEYTDLGTYDWGLVELVEAATHSGEPDAAAAAAENLAETAQLTETDWARGVAAGSRAMVSDSSAAEALYNEAIERLGRTRIRVQLARTYLNFGEWLRREGRRADAREPLRRAHDLFSAMGAEAFAERARRELAATGETVRKRSVETHVELTPQETLIVRLATEGRTNPEIAAELFISPRTVEWHLRKVYGKLGVSSRKELRGAWPNRRSGREPA
jgi:DNA-binding NarL/FixJ family response regulator